MMEIRTAETARGRDALTEVMAYSYRADIDAVPPAWARVLVLDGVPVSYLLVDPRRAMAFPRGELPYAFMEDAATREDRRREGHFRRLLEDTCAALRQAGLALLVTHGRAALYRHLGFEPFTHQCGLLCTVEQVEAHLGGGSAAEPSGTLRVEESRTFRPGMLLVSDVEAPTIHEAVAVLRRAAALARERGHVELLIEHPSAPSYGSAYPIHPTLETPLATLVRACGGEQRITGSAPEGRPQPHADWAVALAAPALLAQALPLLAMPAGPLPAFDLALCTEVGDVTLRSDGRSVRVLPGSQRSDASPEWSAGALAQLATGYLPVEMLAMIHHIRLSPIEADFLGRLFPPTWRLSRNESWVFGP